MVVGASIYLIYHAIPSLHTAGPVLLKTVKTLQPVLLFLMLFLSFCKIEPGQMKPHRWMVWHLLIQCGSFALIALLLMLFPDMRLAITLEAAALCLICPTATACAVVTGKLGGNMAAVVTYTVIINLAVAIVVPLIVPLLHPVEGLTFGVAFVKILAKVFPLLIMPCLLAWLIRYTMPKAHAWFVARSGWSFQIWAVSLSMAILMSVRAIVASRASVQLILGIALGSLLACVLQFWIGKAVGRRYGSHVSAGQALGQKNTVFAIWMGYTFMTPITSVAGGFYSIWHNCYNTWQLYRKRKADELSAAR